ncbi:MAG TPA: choice-of-anchor Q domain-containing protein [Pirellulales bacterium]|jgi:hypothetical protein|nr:choice-of-anchor Q domain-containing protein [Pirellulales bacterium]
MKVPHWLRGRKAGKSFRGSQRQRDRRLGFESLEERRLLIVSVNPLVVTTTSDAVSHSGVSLRDAIGTANADARSGKSDTITFAAGLNGQTIVLSQGSLELGAGGAGSGMITINGAGNVAISGNNAVTVFLVDSGVTATLEGLTITSGNDIPGNGGGGINNLGTLTVTNSTISNCTSTYIGGGIYNQGTSLTVSGSTLSYDSATGGGAIYSADSMMLNVSNSTFTFDSAAGGSGGAIGSGDPTTISGSTFSSDSAAYGGAIEVAGAQVTISNSTITNNTASNRGGAMDADYASQVTVSNSTISNNSSSDSAGGIYLGGTLTLYDSTVSGNSSYDGAGIWTYQNTTLTVSNSTIANNISSDYGGGLFYEGNANVSNSTISGNSAQFGAGGIYQAGYLRIVLMNTVVAGNTAGSESDISGFVDASSSNNLIGDGTGMAGIANDSNGNQIGGNGGPVINPMLTALANYGGATQVMALQAGSPAINAGGAVTTLASSINSTTASFSTSVFANFGAIASSNGTYLIQIDSEQMLITDTNGTLTVTRHVNGTTAAMHNVGAVVTFPTDQIGDARVGTADIGAYEYHGTPASINNFGSTVNYTPGGAAVALASAATVTAGTNGVASSKLTVTINNSGSYDVATIATGNGVTIAGTALIYGGNTIANFAASNGATPLVVQFTSKATTAAVQAVIDDVVFSNTSNGAWIYDRTVSFQLTDSKGVVSAAATKTIHFVAAPPAVSGLGSTTNYTSGSGPTTIAPSATVSGANNLENSKLVVSIGNAGSSDKLVISAGNGITLASSITAGVYQVLYNGTIVGWYQPGSGSTLLVVQFNSSATIAAVQAVVDDIAYYNTTSSMSVYDRTISFSLTDELNNVSMPATKTIHVSAGP